MNLNYTKTINCINLFILLVRLHGCVSDTNTDMYKGEYSWRSVGTERNSAPTGEQKRGISSKV